MSKCTSEGRVGVDVFTPVGIEEDACIHGACPSPTDINEDI